MLKEAGNLLVEKLDAMVIRMFGQADEMARAKGGDKTAIAAERAEILAVSAGATAKRLGVSDEDLKRWLQGAYGRIWVRLGSLNPGLDLKEVSKIMLGSYTRAR